MTANALIEGIFLAKSASDSMVHSACCFSVTGQPSHFVNAAAKLPIPVLLTVLRIDSVLGRLANDHAACAFPSMTLFLVAILVLAAGLLGTLFLLFRDAHRGTKGLKHSLLSNWK
jgi:hypothetical protein